MSNAINPGPGYRIVYHSEPPQDGIEYWSEGKQRWLPRHDPAYPLSHVDTYRIAVDQSQRYRIKGTGSKCDGQIVDVVEWGEKHCLVRFFRGQTWIERRCLEPIQDHIADAKKKAGWVPKVGDWVKITKPNDLLAADSVWLSTMDSYDGAIVQVFKQPQGCIEIDGFGFLFDWLTPYEPLGHFVDANKKVEPVVKQSLTSDSEYIEPTMEHVGQMVQGSNNSVYWSGELELLAVFETRLGKRFAICLSDDEIYLYEYARIKPQLKPKYRDVTTDDIGKAIQVRDSDKDQWVDCSLLRISETTTHSEKGTTKIKLYVCNLGQAWAQARIVDGGEA